MATLPLPTLAAQISATGISAPLIEDVLASETATYQGIYGSDTVLTPDQPDGELLGVRATVINDLNNLAIAVYNSYSPTYAQGVGLSANVQTNGLKRVTPSNSTATATIGGVVGATILGGVAIDTNSNLWNLPASVTIPESGAIDVTVTAQQPGAISAIPGAINRPYTILTEWQTITNAAAATPGIPVESDPTLRQRQAVSTSLPAQTPLQSIAANIAQLPGVGRIYPYENQNTPTDGNGVQGHSIAMIVEGGNVTDIAQVIEAKKAPGTGTYGTTTIIVQDPAGVPIPISFFELDEVSLYAAITIQPLNGYVATTATAIVNALVAFINSLPIGQQVYYNWLLSVAGLSNSPLGQTFAITGMQIGTAPGALAAANVAVAFNQGATTVAANIQVTS